MGYKFRWWHAGLAVGVGWICLRATRPKWYDDLMLRAFAGDQLVDQGKTKQQIEQFEQAADLAARFVLPLGWVLRVVEISTGTSAEEAVRKMQAAVLQAGPPADTQANTLAAYKAKALAAGGVAPPKTLSPLGV